MKTIGLIGGLSWESSIEYYRIINETVRERLGGHHNAVSLMHTVNFHEVEAMQHRGDWDGATAVMVDAAQRLERGGAGCVVICSNTMHRMANEVQNAVDIPLLHIADATAQKVKEAGIRQVALLGTAFTMEQDFYKGRLIDNYGLDVLVPDANGRKLVHDVIYNELVQGVVKADSREGYRGEIKALVERGAEGVILGCTEIGLLVKPEDSPVPTFDTTTLHAFSAVAWALSEEGVR